MKATSQGRGGTDHLATAEEVLPPASQALIDEEGVLDEMFMEMAEHVGLKTSRTHELSVRMFDALVAEQRRSRSRPG